MKRRCVACKKDHKDVYFPSAVSTQCATSMLNNNRTPILADLELPFIRCVATIEVESGLPIRSWVGKDNKWHTALSQLLYGQAMENPDSMRNNKRIQAWLTEELPFATKN